MSKDKIRQMVIAAVLVGVLAFSLWSRFIQPAIRQRSDRLRQAIELSQMAVPPPPLMSIKDTVQPIRDYENKNWGKNPFMRVQVQAKTAAEKKKVLPEFELAGIIWDSTSPYAIIDGEVRAKGDQIGEFRIKAIGRDTVSLSNGEDDIELRLFPELPTR